VWKRIAAANASAYYERATITAVKKVLWYSPLGPEL
jgi:hypothetical protein